MEDLNSRMPSLTDAEFNDLVKIIYDKTRIQMSEHKRALVNSRIIKRLRALNMSSFKEYIDYLLQYPKDKGKIKRTQPYRIPDQVLTYSLIIMSNFLGAYH